MNRKKSSIISPKMLCCRCSFSPHKSLDKVDKSQVLGLQERNQRDLSQFFWRWDRKRERKENHEPKELLLAGLANCRAVLEGLTRNYQSFSVETAAVLTERAHLILKQHITDQYF